MEAAGFTVSLVGLPFSVAQTVFAALQCQELKDLLRSDLESLESSVASINAMLLDADTSQANGIELNHQERNFIEQIKDVVYDADDLLDAYVTRAKLQQINMESSNTLSEKVWELCSRFKHLVIDTPEFKRIANKLDRIVGESQNFKFVSRPITIKREETSSVLTEDHIVGREDDQRRIVEMLLNPIIQGDLPVLAIVGVGGLGKTSLAQLVYNDPQIQQEFSLRLWVCVSDQDRNQFNLNTILADIYKSTTPEESIGDMGLDLLVQKLKSKLDQHKYLLVLDDLWNEKSDECRKMVNILRGSVETGNRIVVTTRSKKTAKAIGSSQPYELQGLSDENSWHLFELKVGREIKEGHDLFEIGKDIVKKCINVPLAIKVVGSLLCGAPNNEWKSFQQSRLIDIKKDDNDIMNILKFSYYHLSPSLKSCFTYCAIFPKDFEIQKENLINMWMAHDYVKDEDEAEYYFQILVQRCFFEVLLDDYAEEISFTIHDLMHDMAQEIAGNEIYIANSATTNLDKGIRHLNDGAPATRTKAFVTPAKIRSYVHDITYRSYISNIQFLVSTVLANWRHLRVLDLHELGIIQLPKEIGGLLHLRYLDLSGNGELRMLPEALTKLINLQCLNLDECGKLKELPGDFKKLVSLRNLCVPDSLEYMPLDMGGMTSLTKLNKFIVGHRKSSVKQENMLESLRVARNLKGSLNIRVKKGYKHAKEFCGEGGYICNTHHLNSITIRWDSETNEEGRVGSDEDVLEYLHPHRNLKKLEIMHYHGVKIPGWAREDSLATSLPNLVKIELWRCEGLKELPWLGGLQHLKTLELNDLENVEYMENRRSIGSSNDDGAAASNLSTMLFFPSLEELVLEDMPKLGGWWGGNSIVNNDNNICMLTTPAHPLPSFPSLSLLHIRYCPNLTYIPPCPAVETLELSEFNGVIMIEEDKKRVGCSSGNVVGSPSTQYLKALPTVAFQCLVSMEMTEHGKVESLLEYEEVFRSCSSSLRFLTLQDCNKLRSVYEGGLEYLTALEELELSFLPELEFDEEEENEEEMPWRCLGKCLRSLKLARLEKVDNLPKWMRYLIALQSLEISWVPLKEVPEWIECLSSLQTLEIQSCTDLETLPRALLNLTSLNRLTLVNCSDELKRRCEKPDGEYRPILEHIPQLYISQRHLDLFGNGELKILPEALTKVINLQFLNLHQCDKLKELPRDFKKLVNLRTLYVPDSLEYMPLGMENMTSLTKLNSFVVGDRKSRLKQEDKLEDLRGLRNLKGSH